MQEDELRDLFEEFGEVNKYNIIHDRETGKSKGFAFVEMGDKESAQSAIEALHGKSVNGRNIVVNEARAREDRSNNKPRRNKNW